jgi:peptide/nickel transport system substrate-binding protein
VDRPRLPTKEHLEQAIRSFTIIERALFIVLALVFAASSLFMLWKVNENFLVEIPADGGTLTEGVLGYPRYINPLLPITDAGRDLTTLIYSGLMKATSQGELVPDLASQYTVSPDGLVYTFTLKDKATFHDGVPVTADDVIFTISKAVDPELKSPKAVNWVGVEVHKIDDRTIEFKLKKPYAPFLQNTTLGILPKHIWQNTSDEEFSFTNYNVEPIGSGPYRLETIKRNSSGLPDYYHLVPFAKYTGKAAHIQNIYVRFFTNEKDLVNAYQDGTLTSINSISPANANMLKAKGAHIETSPLPRVFGVFLNQNLAPVLANKEVRQALGTAIDRQDIVAQVLGGYGTPIDGPLPKDSLSGESGLREPLLSHDDRIAKAKKLLMAAGWALNDNGIMEKKTKKDDTLLSFTLSTANTADLAETAELLKAQWKEIGADVKVKLYDIGDLNQNSIRPRKYDALLFGEVIGRDLDLFAFWHSSQRSDPGLNISMYANSKADKLLEAARTESDPLKRLDDYSKFEDEFYNDLPALFLYSPDFIYVVPQELRGLSLSNITTGSERFLGVNAWYMETDNVWKIFINN